MRPKTVLALFVIVVALLAFIWFYERELPSSDERGELAKKAILVETDEVHAIELEREGLRVHLVRDSAASDEEQSEEASSLFEDEWRLVEPFDGKADIDMVNSLLNDVESLEKLRELDEIGASEAGLEEPRATLLLHTASGIKELRVGSEVPASGTMIVSVDGGVLVVSDSLWSSLSHEPGDWRSKDLYLGDRDAVETAILETGGARIRLTRRGDTFWIEEPLVDRADRERVRELLGSIVGLRAHSFVDAPAGSLADLGLDPPLSTVELVAQAGQQQFRLEWGRPVPEDESRFFARVGEQVFETSSPLAESLVLGPEEWRALNLTVFETHEIDSVRALDDEGELMLRRAGADWERDDEKVSFAAVSDLLYTLVEARATGFDSLGETQDQETGRPQPILEVTLSDGEQEQALVFGPVTEGRVLAMSSDREAVLTLESEVLSEIRQKLSEVRAAAPLGTDHSVSTSQIPGYSGEKIE